MIKFLDNTDHNLGQAEKLRVAQADPPYPFSIYDTIVGNITRSKNDMYCLSSLTEGYHSLVREDTFRMLDNLKDSSFGNEFELNTYYYLFGTSYLQGSPSTSSGDSDLYPCNPNFYYKIELQGMWDGRAVMNDRNIDMLIAPDNEITFLLESSYDKTSWTLEYSKTFTPVLDTFYFTDDFIIKPSYHKYYRVMFLYSISDPIKPIGAYSSFFFNIVMHSKPRLSWKHRVIIPASSPTGTTSFFITIPATGVLPFMGYYAVHAFVETKEMEFDFSPANCGSSQLLKVSGVSGWETIDVSPTYDGGPSAPDGKMIPNSLQGSVYAKANDYLYLQVELPNGVIKQLLGGYVDIQFMGDFLSPSLII